MAGNRCRSSRRRVINAYAPALGIKHADTSELRQDMPASLAISAALKRRLTLAPLHNLWSTETGARHVHGPGRIRLLRRKVLELRAFPVISRHVQYKRDHQGF